MREKASNRMPLLFRYASKIPFGVTSCLRRGRPKQNEEKAKKGEKERISKIYEYCKRQPKPNINRKQIITNPSTKSEMNKPKCFQWVFFVVVLFRIKNQCMFAFALNWRVLVVNKFTSIGATHSIQRLNAHHMCCVISPFSYVLLTSFWFWINFQ